MALKTDTISDTGSKGHHKFSLKVTEDSTSTSGNTSSVSFKFTMTDVKSGYDWYYDNTVPVTWSLTVAGQSYSGKIMDYDGSGTITLKTGTLTVSHSSDGTKSISYKFSVSSISKSYLPGSASASGSMTLTKIPRQATLTSAPNFNDEANPTITYSNPAGSAVTSLMACISLDKKVDQIKYRSIKTNLTSYTFDLQPAEREILRKACTGKSMPVYFYVRTNIGGTYYYSRLDRTMSIVNGNPTFSASNIDYQDSLDVIKTATGTSNTTMIVQNKSNLTVTCRKAAAVTKNATKISKYEFWLSNDTKNVKTLTKLGTVDFGKITSASNLTLYVRATDSRGFSTTVSKTVTCYQYYKPTISIAPYRSDSVGKAQDGGQFAWCSKYTASIASVNKCNKIKKVELFATPISSTASLSADITSGSGGVDLGQDNEDMTYKVHAKITDAFGESSISSAHTIYGTQKIINIYPDGTGVAFGMTSTGPNRVEIKGDLYVKGILLIDIIHPVGSVFVTSTNTNPSTTIGGTWTLINKSFTPYGNTSSTFFTPNSNISDVSCAVIRNDSTLRIRLTGTINYKISDTTTTIGKFNWDKIGVTSIPYGLGQYPAGYDYGSAVVLCTVEYDTGNVSIVEAVGYNDATGGDMYLDFTIPVGASNMLDSACNQFHWKRTK